MLPMRPVRLQLGNLLAADTTTLNQATNANHISLINAPFTPNENMTPASLSLATFTGSTPISVPFGAQGTGIDPVTQEQIITILAPAGGYRWVCSATPTTPDTIYGFALLDKTNANLWAVAVLPVPQIIAIINDVIDLGAVTIRIVLQPAS